MLKLICRMQLAMATESLDFESCVAIIVATVATFQIGIFNKRIFCPLGSGICEYFSHIYHLFRKYCNFTMFSKAIAMIIDTWQFYVISAVDICFINNF